MLAAAEKAREVLDGGQTLFARRASTPSRCASCSCSPPSRSCTSSTSTRPSWPTRRSRARLRDAGRAGRGRVPRREDRGRADRPARRRGARAAAVDRPGRVRALASWPASASHTLGLQTYLTAGPKEARAWTIPKGATAPEAAGVIHTDFQRGFIKAEIVSYDDLVAAGSMAEARAARQGPHGGQGLRHAGRRRRRVPLQRVAGCQDPLLRKRFQRLAQNRDTPRDTREGGVDGAPGVLLASADEVAVRAQDERGVLVPQPLGHRDDRLARGQRPDA